MTLKGYFEELEKTIHPKTEMMKKLVEECKVNHSTVSRWVRGLSKPSVLHQEKISEIVGLPVEQLFPQEHETAEP